jgi:hypothetical protein
MPHHRGMESNAADDDAEWQASLAEEEADRQRKLEPPPPLTPQDFAAWRSPRVVVDNPTRLDNPLWHWLVRTRWSAYQANQRFHGPSPFGAGPMWCFDRFGMSATALPDGRVVHIGGEHEDYYDPDFCIYNDVTVIGADGDIAIHAYPREDFPPTDFHSASLVGGGTVIVIGCLGYADQRTVGETPVYRLALDSMRMSRVATHGEAPGWIHGHTAELSAAGGEIVVKGGEIWRGERLSMAENIDAWSLRLADGRWTRLSALDWQTWTMLRVDRKHNRLWDVRQEQWRLEHLSAGLESHWKHADQPDFEALAALYTPQAGAPAPARGREHNEYVVRVDGVAVRFLEEGFTVRAVVEGRLADERLAALQRRTLQLLERLDASPWEIEA